MYCIFNTWCLACVRAVPQPSVFKYETLRGARSSLRCGALYLKYLEEHHTRLKPWFMWPTDCVDTCIYVSLPSSSLTSKRKHRQCCVCCERITQRPRPLVSHLITWTHKNTSHTTHNTHVWEMQRLCWQWLLRGIQRWYQYFKQVDLSSFQGDVCVFLKSQNQTWTRYQRWWFECVLRKCTIRTHSRLKI